MAKKKFRDVSPEELETLSKQHGGKLFVITVPFDEEDQAKYGAEYGEEAGFYVRRPSKAELRAIAEISEDKKQGKLAAGEVMVQTCTVAGDMFFLSDEFADSYIYMGFLEKLGELFDQKKGTLKKVSEVLKERQSESAS